MARLTKTEQLRRNVKRTIRSMENRGYRLPDDLLSYIERTNYQGLKSLQNNRYKKLYEEATAEHNGRILSGTEARRARASEAQRESWERRRRKQDEIDKQRAANYQEGEIVYNNITELISQYPTKGAVQLSKMLSYEISRYGKDSVVASLAQAPDTAIQYAQTIVFYEEDKDGIATAIREFSALITGTKPTADELKNLGETMDAL